MSVTRLKVDDQDFLVSSLIERCPKIMMLRELTQNALEAADRLPSGQGVVRIGSAEIDGVRKLRIWNSAIGLDRRELHRMCDIATSLSKQKALNLHFGMGAKVTSLGANPLGVRYRSCKAGVVYEVVIGKRDGLYGRVWRHSESRQATSVLSLNDVVDVTQVAIREGADVSRDWVDVVLMGQRQEQDTVVDPYDGDLAVPQQWVTESLFYRFFRTPERVKLILEPSVTGRPQDLEFEPLSRLTERFERWETVEASDGMRLHYAFDPPDAKQPWLNRLAANGMTSASGFVAVVHGGEMYDLRRGSPWAYIAPAFGVTIGARHITALVELPEGHPVIVDGYRQFLRYANGDQQQVYTPDFSRRVREARPAWLAERLEHLSSQSNIAKKLRGDLKTLASRLGVTFRGAPSNDLEIVILTDSDDIRGRWLDGRVGSYYPETAQLFINSTFDAVELLNDVLLVRARGLPDAERVAAVCADIALMTIVRVVARALIFGLAKSARPDLWHASHIEKAIAPEALSICASDIDLVVDRAEADVQAALASEKPRT